MLKIYYPATFCQNKSALQLSIKECLIKIKEPVWFKHFDPVFCETNGEMKLTSSATETSFLNEQDGDYEEEQKDKEDIFSGDDDMDENNELEIEASNELNIGYATSSDKKKWLWYPIEKLNKLDPINRH